jgi:hypothetical protein
MSTVGTLVKFPGVIWLPVPVSGTPPVMPAVNQILRGHLVEVIAGVAQIMQAAIVAATRPLYGVALSDADADLAAVSIATGKGIATVSVMPVSGITGLAVGVPLFQAATPNFGQVATAGVGPIGYCVSPQLDALGNIEMAFFSF